MRESMMPNRIFFLFIFTILLACSLQAQKPIIMIGGDFNYPPYEYLDGQLHAVGYNVELSRELSQIMNVEPRFRLAKWSQVLLWLDGGQVDLVQGMALSAKRASQYHFSQPHTQTWRSIFTSKKSGIRSSSDLAEARIAVQKGDIALDYLKQVNYQGRIVEVATQEDALHLVENGKSDAAIINHINGMYYLTKENLGNIVVLDERILTRDYCYVSKDAELIRRVNAALDELKRSGKLSRLQDKWFASYYDWGSKKITVCQARALSIALTGLALLFLGLLIVLIRGYRNYKHSQRQITILREAESELLREKALFEVGPILIYKLQIEPLKLIYVSSNVSQWGYNVQEALHAKRSVLNVIVREDRDWVKARIDHYRETKPDSDHKQYRIRTKAGETRWVYDYCLAVPLEGEKEYYYGYIIDITATKELEAELIDAKEKAESASIAKGHFLAQMSHEIRTPLNGILGLINVLQKMDSSQEQKEIYEMLDLSGQNLHKIVSDVLDLSKIESGKLDLVESEFSLQFMIRDLVRSFAMQNQNSALDIRCELGESLPESVLGDMLRLRQVLSNLMHNAVKFTSEGWVQLSADLYTDSPQDIRVIFSVTDTGIGIESSKLNSIFDTYGQADSMTFSNYGGTGLGLSIVKRLVELMNGFIWVESESGKGSEFYFIIPFRKANVET